MKEAENSITDEELLKRYRTTGDTHWMGLLLKRYTLLLFGVCMKYLKDQTEAHDAVQQIFLKVLTEASKYEIEYFKSWLYMVARNHCLMTLRNRGKMRFTEISEEGWSEENLFERKRDGELRYDYLSEALQELNEDQRQCVILFYLDKLSYQEISEKTGYSLSAVKSHIQNGKRNLKISIQRKEERRPPHE